MFLVEIICWDLCHFCAFQYSILGVNQSKVNCFDVEGTPGLTFSTLSFYETWFAQYLPLYHCFSNLELMHFINFLRSMSCGFSLHVLPLNYKWGDNDIIKDSVQAWHFIGSAVLRAVVSCAFVDSWYVSVAVDQWKLTCPVLGRSWSWLWVEITSNKWE